MCWPKTTTVDLETSIPVVMYVIKERVRRRPRKENGVCQWSFSTDSTSFSHSLTTTLSKWEKPAYLKTVIPVVLIGVSQSETSGGAAINTNLGMASGCGGRLFTLGCSGLGTLRRQLGCCRWMPGFNILGDRTTCARSFHHLR